jgi:enterochelin esterase-like enzyme
MMAYRIAGVGLVLTFLASAAVAQVPPPPPSNPAGRGGPGGRGPSVVSPEISADRTLTLRYLAPNASQVTVSGELDGKPHPMTKDASGIWSVTVGPLAPDIYTYAFNVDGAIALDPRNANTKYGYGNFGPVSVVEIPGDGPQFYDTKPVPHGEVRIRPYVSKTLGLSRTVWVYTPPNYDKGSNFPVMYLLHGAGDIESGWTMIGRAHNILDNLIAEGKTRPMVVVMPLGHTIQSFWTGPARSAVNPAAVPGQPPSPAQPAVLSPFGKDLLEDVMPMIESSYKVSKKADDRAIGGLSMGGGQTMNIAFTRPELFRYVVMMSPAAPRNAEQLYPPAFKDPSALNKQFKLFWMAVGKDDTLTGPGDRALAQAFEQAGIRHQFKLTDGRHEWTVWRHYLNEVAPLLFK